MVLVTLKDGTTYCIDSNSKSDAKYVVDYKLRDRLDYRKIKDINLFEGTMMDRNSRYYNSNNCYDGVPLKCKTGWSYRWSDYKCAEFR